MYIFFVFFFFPAIVGLAGLGYAESEFKNKWISSTHGWSNILCWVGCAGIIIGAIMSLLMCFVVPGSSSNDKNVGVHYVGNRNPTYQHDYAGYQDNGLMYLLIRCSLSCQLNGCFFLNLPSGRLQTQAIGMLDNCSFCNAFTNLERANAGFKHLITSIYI